MHLSVADRVRPGRPWVKLVHTLIHEPTHTTVFGGKKDFLGKALAVYVFLTCSIVLLFCLQWI